MAFTNPAYEAITKAITRSTTAVGASLLLTATACPKDNTTEVETAGVDPAPIDAPLADSATDTAETKKVALTSPHYVPLHMEQSWFDQYLDYMCSLPHDGKSERRSDSEMAKCIEAARRASKSCYEDKTSCQPACKITHQFVAEAKRRRMSFIESQRTYPKCQVVDNKDGKRVVIILEEYRMRPVRGRPPHGLLMQPSAQQNEIAAWFVDAALTEAASVPAFAELGALLAPLGCPVGLLADIDRAADDEERHAASMQTLASAYGAEALGTFTHAPMTLGALAAENFLHGCLGEAMAAALAAYQAKYAEGPIAEAMAVISIEESQHAALSWNLFAWLQTTELAMETASLLEIIDTWEAAQTSEPVSDDARQTLGLPNASIVRDMAQAIAAVARKAVCVRSQDS